MYEEPQADAPRRARVFRKCLTQTRSLNSSLENFLNSDSVFFSGCPLHHRLRCLWRPQLAFLCKEMRRTCQLEEIKEEERCLFACKWTAEIAPRPSTMPGTHDSSPPSSSLYQDSAHLFAFRTRVSPDSH